MPLLPTSLPTLSPARLCGVAVLLWLGSGIAFALLLGFILILLAGHLVTQSLARRKQALGLPPDALQHGALQAAESAILIIEAQAPHVIAFVNPAFARLSGFPQQELRGLPLWHCPTFAATLGDHLASTERNENGNAEIAAALHTHCAGNGQLYCQRQDGTGFWGQLHLSPIRTHKGRLSHFVGVLIDMSETRRYQSALEYHASRDALTGLANRHLLHHLLEQSLAYASRYEHPVWVVFINLDRFKFVNDTLGHKAGDQLLSICAQRLLAAVRETDVVARLGADEFVLVFPERASERNAETLSTSIVQRCLDALAQPVQIMDHAVFPSASAGVATWPEDGRDADTLLKHADVALNRAKQSGRNQFQFFTASMNEQALARLRIEGDLRNALERGEFVLHYQPQVDLRSGRVLGMEALIRWQHPLLGMIAPQQFIGLAEETGLIVPIGAWVLHTACAQAVAWQVAGFGNLRIAVNLSARQFAQADLVNQVADALASTGLPAACLEIELTETLVMNEVEQAIGTLRKLKALGISLSIDDFGTGYSSLSYLKRFPIDVLKIDQSFVRDITLNADDAAITLSIISLAHSLRLQVIAEGVETEAQLSYLRRHHCDQMQGYYFSRPLPAAEFTEILRTVKLLPVQNSPAMQARQHLLFLQPAQADIASALPAFGTQLGQQLQNENWRLLATADQTQALQWLAQYPCQVLLCAAHALPWLLKVRALYPNLLLIVIGQEAEIAAVLERLDLFRCISQTDEAVALPALRLALEQAFAHYWRVHGGQEYPRGQTRRV